MLKIEKITDKVEELDVQGQHSNPACYINRDNPYYGCLVDCKHGDNASYKSTDL